MVSAYSQVFWIYLSFFRLYADSTSLKFRVLAYSRINTCHKHGTKIKSESPTGIESMTFRTYYYYGRTKVWMPRVKIKSLGWAANRNQPQHRLKCVIRKKKKIYIYIYIYICKNVAKEISLIYPLTESRSRAVFFFFAVTFYLFNR